MIRELWEASWLGEEFETRFLRTDVFWATLEEVLGGVLFAEEDGVLRYANSRRRKSIWRWKSQYLATPFDGDPFLKEISLFFDASHLLRLILGATHFSLARIFVIWRPLIFSRTVFPYFILFIIPHRLLPYPSFWDPENHSRNTGEGIFYVDFIFHFYWRRNDVLGSLGIFELPGVSYLIPTVGSISEWIFLSGWRRFWRGAAFFGADLISRDLGDYGVCSLFTHFNPITPTEFFQLRGCAFLFHFNFCCWHRARGGVLD